ncbi:hypothetical protein EMGBS4_00670 [Acidimicrobiaceae bacterium]|nr:hypothetical protein EMGBS4_00670 [Acidimicrobiaceae bacterium]
MHGPWSPLKIRAFRAIWIAGLVSNIGTFMHIAAAAWTMTTLTDSPTLVGLVQTAWAVPGFLLALYAGAFADMIDRRRLISVTSLFALGVAAVLAVLQWSENLTVALLIFGTFLESVALTLSAPAFMALTPELVDEPHLPPAIGLDAVSRNIAQSVGPAVAGLIIAIINPGAVFALNAVSFIGIVLVMRNRSTTAKVSDSRQAINQVIKYGIKHVAGTKLLRNLALRLAIMLGVTSVLTSVLPIVAKQSLQVASNGFGLLSGALGVGSVGAVWILPRIRAKFGIETITLVCSGILVSEYCSFVGYFDHARGNRISFYLWCVHDGDAQHFVLYIYGSTTQCVARSGVIVGDVDGLVRYRARHLRLGRRHFIYRCRSSFSCCRDHKLCFGSVQPSGASCGYFSLNAPRKNVMVALSVWRYGSVP